MTRLSSIIATSGLVLAMATASATAAEITLHGDRVFIAGTIEHGDASKFEGIYTDRALVLIHSRGGIIKDALAIGKLLRARGWNTSCEFVCESAASLVWMAGVTKYRTATARIGFHSSAEYATFTRATATNHIIMGYLRDLGYNDQTAQWVVSADPNDMTFLTPNVATKLNIQVTTIPQTMKVEAFGRVDLNKPPGAIPPPSLVPLASAIVKKAEQLRQGCEQGLLPCYGKPAPTMGGFKSMAPQFSPVKE